MSCKVNVRSEIGKCTKGLNISKSLSLKIKRYEAKDMTYILGARCFDGVVLIADTKVTIDDGADYTYSKKIAQPLINVIIGSAGIGGLYKDCENRIVSTIKAKEREANESNKTLVITEEEFHLLLTQIIRSMHDDYSEDRHLILNNMMILSANRMQGTIAKLYAFHPYGFPEPVNKFRAIGHGQPYGELFLKKMWNKNMTMEQTAKLGCLIIKFIQDMKLDQSVGYAEEYLPQIVMIPDVPILEEWNTTKPTQEEVDIQFSKYPILELKEETVKDYLNEMGGKIAKLQQFFGQQDFKI